MKKGVRVHQHICRIRISDFTTYPRRREVWSCRRSFCEVLGRGERKEVVAAKQVVCGYHASDPYEMNVRLAAHRSLQLTHPGTRGLSLVSSGAKSNISPNQSRC